MDSGYCSLDGDNAKPRSFSSGCRAAAIVSIVALLGLSAHSTKNALVPVEPVLESMGLSPTAYSLIWAAPTISGVIFAPLWGIAFMRRPVVALVVAPAGTLVGLAIMVAGLMVPLDSTSGTEIALILGWMILCISRAGGEVVQHSVLAQLLPQNLTGAFVVLVFATHMTYVLCNLLVPLVLGQDTREASAQRGVLRVQIVLLIPSLISVLAGSILACCLSNTLDSSDEIRRQLSCKWLSASRALLDWRQWTTCPGMLIIVWGAVAVGVLHAYQSVTNQMLVSFGFSVKRAGSLNACNQTISLAFLAVFGLFSSVVRRASKTVLFSVSLAAFASAALIMVQTWVALPYHLVVWHVALLTITIVGVLAPVLSLALIPEYVHQPGKAYGVLDGLKNLCQFLIVLGIGRLREIGGFQYAMVSVCAGSGILVVLMFGWLLSERNEERRERTGKSIHAQGDPCSECCLVGA